MESTATCAVGPPPSSGVSVTGAPGIFSVIRTPPAAAEPLKGNGDDSAPPLRPPPLVCAWLAGAKAPNPATRPVPAITRMRTKVAARTSGRRCAVR
jgi:hypothetical protein